MLPYQSKKTPPIPTDSKFQFPLRTLFFATAIIGLNAAELVSRNWFLLVITVIGTSVLVSVELFLSHGFSSQSAAKIGFYVCECHCVMWGLMGASFFFLIGGIGGAIFGLGGPDPITRGIIAAIEGLPLSYIAYQVSLRIAQAIDKHR